MSAPTDHPIPVRALDGTVVGVVTGFSQNAQGDWEVEMIVPKGFIGPDPGMRVSIGRDLTVTGAEQA